MLPHRSLLVFSLATSALFSAAGGASAQCLSDRFSSSNGDSGDVFGRAIAVSGDHLLVGASRTDFAGMTNTGSAYLFSRTATGFVEQEEWTAFDAEQQDNFGESLDIDGDWAVVGAYRESEAGSGAGAAYLWHRVGSSWLPGPKLIGSQVNDNDKFGTAVDILDGPIPRLAVSATWHAHSGGSTGGAVYIYEYDTMSSLWNEVQILRSDDIATGDLFGSSLSFDGDRLVVGVPSADPQGNSSGAVYVFDRSGSLFIQSAKIVPADLTAADGYGRDVSLHGDRIASSGRRVYVHELQGSTWVQDASMVGSGTSGGFGDTVDINGDDLIATEYNFGSGGGAWLWSRSSGSWVETGMTSQQSAGDYYGRKAILDGDSFLVSGDSANVLGTGLTVGEVYAYPYVGLDCNSNGTIDSCDVYSGTSADGNGDGVPDECSGSPNYCSSTNNSSGGPAVISSTGSASVSSNSFSLHAGPVPNVPGLFFYGPNQADSAFGNGRLCVGAPIFRLPAIVATGNQASYTYDLTLPPLPAGLITPGSTWNFQFWFRDPGVGAQFDTSDGLSVAFTM